MRTLHQLAKLVLPNICTGKYVGATAELCRRVLAMDKDLQAAIEAVKELNEISEQENGCTMFHVEHIPGSLTRVMKGATVCWDTEDEHSENCDGSMASIIAHAVVVLQEQHTEWWRVSNTIKESAESKEQPTGEREWSIWSEGFAATGERGTATCHGTVVAKTFKEACIKRFKDDNTFNEERLTLWGCRLFDNEAAARKSFG